MVAGRQNVLIMWGADSDGRKMYDRILGNSLVTVSTCSVTLEAKSSSADHMLTPIFVWTATLR